MTNAEKFKNTFGLYATEFWAKPEKNMLEWLNTSYDDNNNFMGIFYKEDFFNYCRICPNNPKNGGSGICHCIL